LALLISEFGKLSENLSVTHVDILSPEMDWDNSGRLCTASKS
jgi:hypothetical protein